MTIIQWILAGMFGLLFVGVASGNAWFVVRHAIRSGKPDGVDLIMFVGGFFGVMAMLLAPVGTIGQRFHHAWLPLVLDIGFLLPFVGYLIYVVTMSRAEMNAET